MEVRLLIEEQIEGRIIVLEEHNLVFDLRHPSGRLLGMLPQIYQDEESTEQSSFFSRYLLGFDEFIDQTNRELDTVHHFFSAFGAPNEFLAWLAQWVAIAEDLPIPEIRKRKLISEAVALYRIRGTKAGLNRLLEICTGVKPIIRDKPTEGFKLGAKSRMGASTTRLGNINEGTFTVVIPCLEPSRLNHEVVKRLIEAYKPAHTRYKLRIVRTIAGETLAAAI
ncbi:MAG TPA: phage tail protein [Fimbriimonadaceae bacterium]|nr:phage tail protein [Fimbriimonadaceae bacterium]